MPYDIRRSGKFDDVLRISIVCENQDTYSDDNLRLKVSRQTPLRVWEFVYRINTPQDIIASDVSKIIKTIKATLKSGKQYNDTTGKLLYAKERVSKNPPSDKKT